MSVATLLPFSVRAQVGTTSAMHDMPHMDIGAATNDATQMDMSDSDDDSEHHMYGMYGQYSMTQEASGTAWQPEATPMDGLHIMNHGWMFMVHGYADGVYDYQGGNRGDKKFFSPNMLMGMAQHRLGPGTFGFRSMLTLEPATIGKTGYPELLQTGETADGRTPLIDRSNWSRRSTSNASPPR